MPGSIPCLVPGCTGSREELKQQASCGRFDLARNKARSARAIEVEAGLEIASLPPVEKLHASLISSDDARRSVRTEAMFAIKPEFACWSDAGRSELGSSPVPEVLARNLR